MTKTRIQTRIQMYEKKAYKCMKKIRIQMYETKTAYKCMKKTRIQMYETKTAYKCMKKRHTNV